MSIVAEFARVSEEPDIDQLLRDNWQVLAIMGPYYTVWRDGEEMLLVWKAGRWIRLGGGGFDGS